MNFQAPWREDCAVFQLLESKLKLDLEKSTLVLLSNFIITGEEGALDKITLPFSELPPSLRVEPSTVIFTSL